MDRRGFLAAVSVSPVCTGLIGNGARAHPQIAWEETGRLFTNGTGIVLETCRVGDSWLLDVAQVFDGRIAASVYRRYAVDSDVDSDPDGMAVRKAMKVSCRNVADAKQWCLDTLHSIAEERRDDATAVLEILGDRVTR